MVSSLCDRSSWRDSLPATRRSYNSSAPQCYSRSQSPLHSGNSLRNGSFDRDQQTGQENNAPDSLSDSSSNSQADDRQARRDFPSTALYKESTSHDNILLLKTTKLSRSTTRTKRATKQLVLKVPAVGNLHQIPSPTASAKWTPKTMNLALTQSFKESGTSFPSFFAKR